MRPGGSRRLSWFVAVAVASGCAGRTVRQSPLAPCRTTVPFQLGDLDVGSPHATDHPPNGPGSLDPIQRRPFRNYISIERVSKMAHHFTVFFVNVEQGNCEVSVLPGPPPHTVAITRCTVGGFTEPPDQLPPIPADLAPAAAAALSAVCTSQPGNRQQVAMYDGSYRELRVHEAVPYTGNGRAGVDTRVDLKATEGLDQITGPGSWLSGWGALPSDPHASSHWVRYVPPPALVGRSLLFGYVEHLEPALDEWPVLASRILEVARAVEAGGTGASRDDLRLDDGDALLPAHLDQILEVDIGAYVRPGLERRLRVLLRANDAIFEAATGSAKVVLGDLELSATARLRARLPIDPTVATADFRAPFALELTLSDGHAPPRNLRFDLDAEMHLERGKGAFVWLERHDLNTPGAADRARLILPETSAPLVVSYERTFPVR
jgi:hypothetical protein